MGNIVTITQIPENQYGYRVQMVDTDGTPLKNVVIHGVDDPNTEIRTNGDGIVQFYSTKSSFTNLTYTGYPLYLDATMFPKTIHGYINDTTVVVVNPDTSKYYGYDLTFTDYNGNPLANTKVYDNNVSNEIGTTDSHGHIILYRLNSSFRFICRATAAGYYVNTTVNGIKGDTVTKTIKASTPIYSGTLALGNTISFCDKDWLVCHIDGNKYYLAASNIFEEIKFPNTTYKGSTLASSVMEYQNKLSNQYPNIVTLYLSNVTMYDVTAKVFAASYEQMNGEFSYFNSNERRICKYNGEDSYYWTSTTEGCLHPYHVDSDGYLSTRDVSKSFIGVRPFICLTL